jgi:hypothetical protein
MLQVGATEKKKKKKKKKKKNVLPSEESAKRLKRFIVSKINSELQLAQGA